MSRAVLQGELLIALRRLKPPLGAAGVSRLLASRVGTVGVGGIFPGTNGSGCRRGAPDDDPGCIKRARRLQELVMQPCVCAKGHGGTFVRGVTNRPPGMVKFADGALPPQLGPSGEHADSGRDARQCPCDGATMGVALVLWREWTRRAVCASTPPSLEGASAVVCGQWCGQSCSAAVQGGDTAGTTLLTRHCWPQKSQIHFCKIRWPRTVDRRTHCWSRPRRPKCGIHNEWTKDSVSFAEREGSGSQTLHASRHPVTQKEQSGASRGR